MRKLFTSMALLLCASVSSVWAADTNYPATVKTFTEETLWYSNADNVSAAKTAGWVTTDGNGTTASKKAKLNPETDKVDDSATSYVAYRLKAYSNRYLYAYVSGVASITGYYQASSGRTLKITATDADDATNTSSITSAGSAGDGEKVTLSGLDNTKSYYILFESYSNGSGSDGYLYAVRFTTTASTTATTLTLDNSTLTMDMGDTQALTPTLTFNNDGSTITGQTFTWTSADESIATVDDNGVVTAKGKGTVDITAAFAGVDGKYDASQATCAVTVNKTVTYKSDFTAGEVIQMTTSYTNSAEWIDATGSDSKEFSKSIDADGNESSDKGKYHLIKTADKNDMTLYVEGISALKVYGYTNGSDSRTMSYSLNDGDATTFLSFSGNDLQTGTIELDASTQYTIKFTGSNNVFILAVQVPEEESSTVDVTLASSGWSTFSSADKAIDFSTEIVGLKAYTAAYNVTGDNVTMTEFTGILAAGNGVVLIGEANGKYSLPVSTETGEKPEGNELVAVTEAKTVACPTEAPYFYALSGGKFLAFDEAGCEFAAGKAYLSCAREYKSSSSAKAIDIVFADDATAINEVSAAQKSAKIYNLQGIEVQNPTNGLYIKNGKKIIK